MKYFKFLFLIVIVSIFGSPFSSLSIAASDNYKIDHIVIINPMNTKDLLQKHFNLTNYYLEKYTTARSQVTLVTTDSDLNPNSILNTLTKFYKQGYQMAVIVKQKKANPQFDIFELSQCRKLWTLSHNEASDLEILFWILDQSLLTGIQIIPKKINVGLVPGGNSDLGPNFPCSTIYKVLRQLPTIKVKPIVLKRYKQYQNQLGELSSKSKLDCILFYESQELQLKKPLFTGSILDTNGRMITNFKVRIESTINGYLIKTFPVEKDVDRNSGRSKSPYIIGPRFETDYGHSPYIGYIADELANYFLALSLTQFCLPQESPLKLKLTKQRKYIVRESPNDLVFPKLDNTVLPDYAIRTW
ncbi:MAG TPA: hypothetical protein DDW65_06045 [Firmicutes bacterium]|jgi:hypothetical protein|nr:hypothetical protein [Bacillota bacterium]